MAAKSEIRNQKSEGFGARSAHVGMKTMNPASGFEFLISNFEFSL